MDEARPINANHLRGRIQAWIKEQESEDYRDIEDATTCYVLDDVLDYIDTEPTIDPESPWREASCPPPTHVDEWDDGQDHYRFELSDEVWIYCIDGTRLLGRYDKENGWFESNGPQISNSYHGCVTHWMPLPEAPKGVA